MAAPTKTYEDIKNLVNDKRRDSTTGTIDDNTLKRAVNESLRKMQTGFIHPTKGRLVSPDYDFAIRQYSFNFFENVLEYSLDGNAADFKNYYDLRRGEDDHDEFIYLEDPEQIRLHWARGDHRSMAAIDHREGKTYLLINHESKYSSLTVDNLDSLTTDGTWAADTTNSDATNVTSDDETYKKGTASLNFDLNVSQSGNSYAIIQNSTMTAQDWSDYEDTGFLRVWVFIPDNTYISQFTARWGSDTSNYWQQTVTTDHNGDSFPNNDWCLLSFEWSGSTEISSPDSENIDFIYLRMSYDSSQSNDTDFRYDYITMEKPEKLYFNYYSQYLVKNSSGTYIEEFSANTDTIDSRATNMVVYGTLEELMSQMERDNEAVRWGEKFKREVLAYLAQHRPRRKRERSSLKPSQISWI